MRNGKRETNSLIVCEGSDEKGLVEAILESLERTDVVDVVDIEGESRIRRHNLDLIIGTIVKSGPKVTRIAIVRDAEDSAKARVQSCQDTLRNISMPVPTTNGEITSKSDLCSGFLVLPVQAEIGSIEDVVLPAVKYPDLLECARKSFECAATKGPKEPFVDFKYKKALCQAYLSLASRKRIYHRCGTAPIGDFFDLTHASFNPVIKFIREFTETR